MSIEEFFTALTPFNYHKRKDFHDYYEKNEERIDKVFRLVDCDKQGAVSFTQFFFFVLMYQTADSVIENEFRKAGGKMNMLQFSKNLTQHRKKTQFGKKHDMLKRDEDDFLETNRQMTQKIFNNKVEIDVDTYLDLKDSIQEMLWHYEFNQYDTDKKETISAFDFAQSLMVYFPYSTYQQYYDHIKHGHGDGEHNHLNHERVTFDEFVAFQYFMKERDLIINYVQRHGVIDQDKLQELADDFSQRNYFCKTKGVKISPHQIEAFLCAMDLDGNKVLDAEEVVGILNKRKTIGNGGAKQKKSYH